MTDSGLITIRAVGDVMTGFSYPRRYLTRDSESFASHRITFSDGNVIDPTLTEQLQSADLTIANLEAVITKDYDLSTDTRPPSMMGPAKSADILADAGIDVVNIDNNHILDHGSKYVKETVQHLESAGIKYIGNPLDKQEILTLKINGLNVNLMGFNLCHEGQTTSLDSVRRAAATLGAKEGISLLSLHWGWGAEHVLHPSPNQVRLAQDLAADVDILIGHHSHTFQPVELNNDSIVAYSLGNFLFDQWRPRNIETGILEVEISETTIENVEITTAKIQRNGVVAAEIPRVENLRFEELENYTIVEFNIIREFNQLSHNLAVILDTASDLPRLPLTTNLKIMKTAIRKMLP